MRLWEARRWAVVLCCLSFVALAACSRQAGQKTSDTGGEDEAANANVKKDVKPEPGEEETPAAGNTDDADRKATKEHGVLEGRALSKPPPVYPAAAKEHRISGTAIISIVVDETGRVIEAHGVCGHPVLIEAAVNAARQARFTPTLLSGLPVKVSGIITYTFVLR